MRSRAPPGWPRPRRALTAPRPRRSATATPAAGPSCGAPSPATWPGPAACASTRTGSWSARGSPTGSRCSAGALRRPRRRDARRRGVRPRRTARHRRRARAAACALPVDDSGAVVDGLGDAAAVLLTPAHQFPLGVRSPRGGGPRAVEWATRDRRAARRGRLRRRVPLRPPAGRGDAGARPEHVVYAGTASKSLAPGLRLGWLVLPAALGDEVVAARELAAGRARSSSSRWPGSSSRAGTTARCAAAGSPTAGAGTRWSRRCGGRCRRPGSLRHRGRAARAGRAARRRGRARGGRARPAGTASRRRASTEFRRGGDPRPPALVVGYGTPPEHAFTGALARLCAALRELVLMAVTQGALRPSTTRTGQGFRIPPMTRTAPRRTVAAVAASPRRAPSPQPQPAASPAARARPSASRRRTSSPSRPGARTAATRTRRRPVTTRAPERPVPGRSSRPPAATSTRRPAGRPAGPGPSSAPAIAEVPRRPRRRLQGRGHERCACERGRGRLYDDPGRRTGAPLTGPSEALGTPAGCSGPPASATYQPCAIGPCSRDRERTISGPSERPRPAPAQRPVAPGVDHPVAPGRVVAEEQVPGCEAGAQVMRRFVGRLFARSRPPAVRLGSVAARPPATAEARWPASTTPTARAATSASRARRGAPPSTRRAVQRSSSTRAAPRRSRSARGCRCRAPGTTVSTKRRQDEPGAPRGRRASGPPGRHHQADHPEHDRTTG